MIMIQELPPKLTEFYKETYKIIPDSIQPISQAGSPRSYFRFFNNKSSILGVYTENIAETETFLYYSEVFSKLKLNTPEVYAVSEDKTCYFIEDFGDDLLLDLLLKRKTEDFIPREIKDLYKKSLSALINMQVKASESIDFEKAYSIKEFNAQSIIFDLNYFKYYFLNPCGISYNEKKLQDDFEEFASQLEQTNLKLFMFRDFQARNILVKNNEVYFIDYQGGRLGAPEYDLVSLLYQAKAELSEDAKLELKDYYFSNLSKHFTINKKDFDASFFRYAYLRVLQTFGAYGLRGLIEKKQHFLDSIVFAIKNLNSLLNLHSLGDGLFELKRILKELGQTNKFEKLIFDEFTVQVCSFSFKKGFPDDKSGNGGGFVFDCRGIHNPGRYPEYRSQTGKDKAVIEFFKTKTDIDDFVEKAKLTVNSTILNYKERGFNSLMINFGCTGGRHRSVYCAEAMAKYIKEEFEVSVVLNHNVIGNF